MKPVRIGVTGPSGDVGHGIVCAMRECTMPTWILALDRTEHYAARLRVDESVVMPPVAAVEYVDALIETLARYRIEYLFCGIDSEVPILSANKDRVHRESGCNVIVADRELVSRCTDKLATADWLTSIGIRTPATWSSEHIRQLIEAGTPPPLPLIVKPRKGHNSIGVRLISDPFCLSDELLRAGPDVCFQEYLPGSEFTCGLLFDRTGCLRDWIVTRRELVGGRTMVAETVDVSEISDLIQDFGSSVHAIGALNIQLRLDSTGRPAVFEINPRMSGSTLLRLDAGHNDPVRILENFVEGTPIAATTKKSRRILREWTTAISYQEVTPVVSHDRPPSTLVLDCGGTLIQPSPAPEAICHRVLQNMGFEISYRKIEEAYRVVDFGLKRKSSAEKSKDDRKNFYRTFNRLIAGAIGIGQRSEEFHDRMYVACTGNLHWVPLPGVVSCLAQLSKHFRLFVLANWDAGLTDLLKRLELNSFFEGVFDSATLGYEKPDPRSFSQFVNQSGVRSQESIYVGNEYEADVIGSRAAGFSPVLLDHTHRYSPGVDCPYVVDWEQLTAALLASVADSNQPGQPENPADTVN